MNIGKIKRIVLCPVYDITWGVHVKVQRCKTSYFVGREDSLSNSDATFVHSVFFIIVHLLVQLQLLLRPVKQRGRQEGEVVFETRAEDHSVDVLLHGAVFKHDSGGGEGLQVGFDHHPSLQDLAQEVLIH